MVIDRKILTIMPKSFPKILSYEDYESLSEDEFNMYSAAGEELKKNAPNGDIPLKTECQDKTVPKLKKYFGTVLYLLICKSVVFCFQEVAV